MQNAREIALLTLCEIEEEGAYSNMALKKHLAKNKHLSGVDKAFVTALVYGVTARKLTLDYMIQTYSKLRLKKISKYILQILRIGIYQLTFMDRVPESAAVDESVKIAKRYGHKAAAGYVNGMLHAVIRGRESFQYPDEPIERLSVKYSYPRWLAEKWVKEFGYEFAQELMKAGNKEPSMTLRTNTLNASPDQLVELLESRNIRAKKSELYQMAIETGGFDVDASDLYKSGYFIPQDTAAMLAAEVLSPKPGETVLDLCAAPGGKSTHLAQLMDNKGTVIAFDIHKHKLALIEENAKRMGISMIQTVCADSAQQKEQYQADKVLADVPCSGLGIIRRKPDIRWNEEKELFSLQYAILQTAGACVKPGGELVYSTCTIEPDENEHVIKKFLKEHHDFKPVDITACLPAPLQKETAKKGYVTLYPNVDGTDGFFIAKMKKR